MSPAALKLYTATVWFIALGEVLLLVLPREAAGSIVAAAVALIIAFVAYPHQKDADRMLELRRERRAIYRSYLSLAAEVVGEIINPTLNDIKLPRQGIIELKSLVDKMIITESEICLVSTRPVRSAVIAFNIFSAKVLDQIWSEAKSRLERGDDASWQEILYGFDNELKRDFQKRHLQLLNTMRQEQFDDVVH